ncbi:MAG TPA: hypothetical protein PK760_05595, partial [Flavobacteriales bacterium]|nr:hypothetical protein [Flavobacteriales bacterium]
MVHEEPSRTAQPIGWMKMLCISVLVKVLLVVCILLANRVPLSGPWYEFTGDSADYVYPADSLLAGEGYNPDHRMPGFAVVYFLLRLLLSSEAALNALVVAQVLADAMTAVLAARIAFHMTGSERIERYTFILAVLATFLTVFDRTILTETFTAFAIMVAVERLARRSSPTTPDLIISGIALTWAVFLKPVMLPLFPMFGLIIAISMPGWRHRLNSCLLLVTPLLLVDGAWVLRNELVHQRFQPLTPALLAPELEADVHAPLIQLMQAYGGSYVWWEPNSEIRWFGLRTGSPVTARDTTPVPPIKADLFTRTCTADTLARITADVAARNTSTSETERAALLTAVRGRCARCIASLKSERPLHYWVGSRLSLLRHFLVNSGTNGLTNTPFPQLGLAGKSIKLFYTLFYWATIMMGLLGALHFTVKKDLQKSLRIAPVVVLYGVLIFPFGMRLCENRYLSSVFVLMIPLAVVLCSNVFALLRSRVRHPMR